VLAYVGRRLLLGLATVWVISVAAFIVIKLPPGDFVSHYLSQLAQSGTNLSEREAAFLRAAYGLDKPWPVQYVDWIAGVLQGNLGISLDWGRPVRDVIGERLPMTILVSLSAVIFAWIIALPIGVLSALRQHSFLDYLFTFLGFLGLAVPNFLLALVLMYVGFVYFGSSIGGLNSPEYVRAEWSFARVMDLLKHLPIPAIVLALAGTTELIRVLRANLLDELRQPYVTTARAKGLPTWRVVTKYPMRVAVNPLVSSMGFLLPDIVSGTIIVSLIFSLPTVGPLLLQALLAQDMFLAGAIVLLLGTLTVIGVLLSDLLLAWIDPRVRLYH
jgi:peptide/nickel transport system permease protein